LILSDWNRCLQSESIETTINSPATTVPQRHPWRGYFFIAAATFCWGGAATLGKAVFTGRTFAGHSLISPLVLTQVRTTVTVVLLMTFLLVRDRRQLFKISRRDLALCALTGTLGIAGSNFFYYYAIQKTTVAIAITVQYIAPVWVLLYMVLRGRQRATPGRILAVLLALLGTALAIGLFHSGANLGLQSKAARLGIASAVLASFSFTFYNIAAQGLVTRNPALRTMNYALLSAAVMWLVVNPPNRLLAQHYSSGQWIFLFVFGCLSMLLPYIFYFTGLKYLDPTRAVITSCLEPVFAIVFAAMFVNEPVRLLQGIGIVLVLVATVMVQRSN
jgi:drug/metabolite transporter (DMT)-like permease